ncbi:hypothetical protein [Paracoccus denitrificans]|uniref:hypothetical protein n=1 Tax=Paracoccus denitrificans TaxID=266 RepID=UPI003364CD60
MTLALKNLGADLDRLSENGRASIRETQAGITVSGLSAHDALTLAQDFRVAGWHLECEDEAGEPVVNDEDFDPHLGTFRLTGRQPFQQRQRIILSKGGLRQALSEPDASGSWQVACCERPFCSGLAQVSPLGSGDIFTPSTPLKSPHALVREAFEPRRTPVDIRQWLIREGSIRNLFEDPAFCVFAQCAAPCLALALCNECGLSDSIVFVGPPRMTLTAGSDMLSELTEQGFEYLHNAVAWVYEDPSSTEQRHALLSAEIARLATRGEKLSHLFNSAGNEVIQSARLSYQLSLSDLSREAIKAQADLRKAIADDTAKAAESTRTLSTAVTVSIATAVTLIAARSTGTADPLVVSLVAAAVAIYLISIAVNGWLHLRLQRDLREQWRRRFYTFVAAEDYDAMVTQPARLSERPYHIIGSVAILVAVLLIIVAVGSAVFEGEREYQAGIHEIDPTAHTERVIEAAGSDLSVGEQSSGR